MSLVVIDNDPWIVEYEMCEKLHRDILDLLNKRSVELKISDVYAHLSSSIRIRLKQFENEVLQLENKLRESAMSRSITFDEAERRERLIENLKTKSIQLHRRFNERDSMSKMNRSELLDNQYFSSPKKLNSLKSSEWVSVDSDDDSILPENSSYMNTEQLRYQQKQIMKDQEAGLEELSKTISKQKDIAIKIDSEVNIHNEIIDDISSRMERTTSGLQNGTNQINIVSRNDSTCGYWMIIILLFVAIIAVLVL